MDVDLRKLRYFVAVAECAGFRRAAEVLHIAQPALTRQIRALEGEMHAELFVRSCTGTALTEAGLQLLEDAQPLLATANSLRDRIAWVTSRPPRLTVGFMQGITIAPIVRRFSKDRPLVDVELVESVPEDSAQRVLAGTVDLLFAREPIDPDGLQIERLFEEPRVVALPSDSPLARLDYLGLRDLRSFRVLQDAAAAPEFADRPPARGLGAAHEPASGTMVEMLERVAAGLGIVLLPASVASLYARPDVAYRAVDGLEPSSVVLAHPRERTTRDLRRFVDLALRHAAPAMAA